MSLLPVEGFIEMIVDMRVGVRWGVPERVVDQSKGKTLISHHHHCREEQRSQDRQKVSQINLTLVNLKTENIHLLCSFTYTYRIRVCTHIQLDLESKDPNLPDKLK